MSIGMMWSKNAEISFFRECKKFASPEQLSYLTDENKYLAYWPKNYKGKKINITI